MYEMGLFREREKTSEKVILRVTERQKNRIVEMAKNAGMKTESRFVISLISREHEFQLSCEEIEDVKNVGDDMPL